MSRGSDQAWCRTKLISSDRVSIRGSGTPAKPYEARVILDPAENNELATGPDGLRMNLPTSLSMAVAAQVRVTKPTTFDNNSEFRQPIRAFGNMQWGYFVPYDSIVYDTSAIFDPSTARMIIPRAGLWEFSFEANAYSAGFLDQDVSMGIYYNERDLIVEDGEVDMAISYEAHHGSVQKECGLNDRIAVVISTNNANPITVSQFGSHFTATHISD